MTHHATRFPIRLALLVASWLGSTVPVSAQTTYTWTGPNETGGNAADWLTPSNWTPTGSPGVSGSNTPLIVNDDVAVFAGANYTNVGIPVGGGVDTRTLGEIRVTGSNALVVGNSTAAAGLPVRYLTLRGGAVSGTSKVILSAAGGDITIQSRIGAGEADAPLTLRLANQDGSSVVSAAAGRTITINTAVNDIGPFTAGTSYGLVKRGGGTLVLNGAGSYTGTTTIEGGTMLVNNSLYAAGSPFATPMVVSFANGERGTLGGTGTINGSVAVERFGADFGTLTAGSGAANTTLTTGAVNVFGNYRVQLFGTGSGEASRVASTGVVTLNSPTAVLELSLNGWTVEQIRATGAKSYTVLSGTGVTGTFSNAPTNGTVDFTALGFNSAEWNIQYTANTVVLNFSPVPEPVGVLAVVAGVIGLGRVARRLTARR